MTRALLLTLALAALLAGCGTASPTSPPTGVDELVVPTPSPDPDDFVAEIDNPWFAGDPDAGRPSGTERVGGVEVTVVGGDYFAQDRRGNVWYLGENTATYRRNGQVESREGSWEAGVDGGQAGILLPADPQVGTGYRQEYLKGQAEDEGFVLSTDEQVQTPTGIYEGTLMTRDTSPLEPELVELKFYAKGVGPVMEVPISGESGRTVLTGTTRTG